MRSGKLPPELLARLIGPLAPRDPRITVGPRPGEDAAVIDLGPVSLIVTTDPITFVSERAAWYAVQVNANDVAAMGGDPAWLAVTLLLPPSTVEADLQGLFDQLRAACDELGIDVVTGHTEITPAVVRPVVVGTMLGLARPGGPITSAGAMPGDVIILAGPVAIEGTVALASEASGPLRQAGLSEGELAAAAGLLTDPGISVVRAARVIGALTRPHALHDATEGGVATALREVAAASGVGMAIAGESLPLLPATRRVCEALELNALGLISSGCLIAVVGMEDAGPVLDALHGDGLVAARVGEVTLGSEPVLYVDGRRGRLPEFDRDELARYFDEHGTE